MSMHDLDFLSDENLAQYVNVRVIKWWVRCLRVQLQSWQVVNLHPVGEVADAETLIGIASGKYDNFMA
jgi:hypothetical protein